MILIFFHHLFIINIISITQSNGRQILSNIRPFPQHFINFPASFTVSSIFKQYAGDNITMETAYVQASRKSNDMQQEQKRVIFIKNNYGISYQSPKRNDNSVSENSELVAGTSSKTISRRTENLLLPSVPEKFWSNELTIELGLFVDDALWLHFQKMYESKAESVLKTYVFAIIDNINALFGHPSLNQSVQIVVNYYAVMKIPPVEMLRNLHGSGDAARLLDLFCTYQSKINRNSENTKQWDHALLFTGYDLYHGTVRTLAGYAPVNGMCSETRSCTISEAFDFSAVFIIAHEMGHNLGMKHDGENGCNESCCIMSTSIGSGRTLWSPCSVQELNLFITELDKNENCLRRSNLRYKRNPIIRSGQLYTLDEQCIQFHGECWKHEVKHGEHINNVCKMIWCSNGEGIIRSAHPALEYSYCGHQMWCIRGQCIPTTSEDAILRHGSWSNWKELKYGSCTSKCVPCEINGQIRVRRSTRICDNPFPHNGGSYCYGDDTRGIRCQKKKCKGLTVEQYATESCTKLRDSDDPTTKNLTGKGMQYYGDLCKIWCLLPHNQIRTTSIFPDGTPCGREHYCIKGRCRKLECNGQAVVALPSHCPRRIRILSSNDDTRIIREHAKIALNNRTSDQLWSEWSKWSNCTALNCGQKGFRLRKRTFISGQERHSTYRQRQLCYGECTADELQWSEWSACSISCGFGVKQRVRLCSTCNIKDEYTEKRTCFLMECKNNTGHWSASFTAPELHKL